MWYCYVHEWDAFASIENCKWYNSNLLQGEEHCLLGYVAL